MTAERALTTLSNLCRSIRLCASASMEPRGAIAVLVCAVASLSIADCATAGPFNPAGIPSGQVTRVGQICQSVMGIEPGEEHYYACVSSLSDSVKGLDQSDAMQRAHSACAERGLEPDSPGFAECVLRTSDAAALSGANLSDSGTAQAVSTTDRRSSKSYFYTSPRDVFHREQLACARLGFDPAYSAFDSCVASLGSALFDADNPMN
jgi:hypothetical protein